MTKAASWRPERLFDISGIAHRFIIETPLLGALCLQWFTSNGVSSFTLLPYFCPSLSDARLAALRPICAAERGGVQKVRTTCPEESVDDQITRRSAGPVHQGRPRALL